MTPSISASTPSNNNNNDGDDRTIKRSYRRFSSLESDDDMINASSSSTTTTTAAAAAAAAESNKKRKVQDDNEITCINMISNSFTAFATNAVDSIINNEKDDDEEEEEDDDDDNDDASSPSSLQTTSPSLLRRVSEPEMTAATDTTARTSSFSSSLVSSTNQTLHTITPRPSAIFENVNDIPTATTTTTTSSIATTTTKSSSDVDDDQPETTFLFMEEQEIEEQEEEEQEDNSNKTNDLTTTLVIKQQSSKPSTSPPSSSSMFTITNVLKCVVEMFIVQFIVLSIMTLRYQYHNKLTLKRPHHITNNYHIHDGGGNNQTLSYIQAMYPTQTSTSSLSMSVHTDNNNINNDNNNNNNKEDCIYVPGGGFSGFWFSMGRLQSLSIEQIYNETFVCYSAGCLSVIATLLQHHQHHHQQQQQHYNITNDIDNFSSSTSSSSSQHRRGHEELYKMARNIQIDWSQGRLHRYQVVETFIDHLLDNIHNDSTTSNEYSYSTTSLSYQRFLHIIQNNLYIVTTIPADKHDINNDNDNINNHNHHGLLLKATLQQPNDLQSLKRMLLQTTWIPMAVGPSFTYYGHLDGAFSTIQHPTCSKTVGLTVPTKRQQYPTSTSSTTMNKETILPFVSTSMIHSSLFYDKWKLIQDSWILWSNTLNVNLGKQHVEDLWQMGLEHGV